MRTGTFMRCVWINTEYPTLLVLSEEAWLHFIRCANSQNNNYWFAENPMLIHDTPLHDVTFGVWCAISAARIGTFPFHWLNSHRCYTHFDTVFSTLALIREKLNFFKQRNAMFHAAYTSMRFLQL